jgi:hypothetical protein
VAAGRERRVTTVEGRRGGELSRLRQAFLARRG